MPPDSKAQLDELAARYHENGFVRIRKFFSAEEVSEIRAALARYVRDTLPTLPAADRVVESDGRSIRNLWRMDRHDPFFKQLGGRPEILSVLPEFLHGEPVCLGIETFNKPARVGSGVPWHQDNAYFCLTPPDALTLWAAIDAVTPENGAVYYLRGSQQRGLLPHAPSQVTGNSMKLEEPPEAGEEFCATLNPGDVVFHHCQTLHRSEPNTTGKPRCGLLIVYRGAHAQHDPKLKAYYNSVLAAT